MPSGLARRLLLACLLLALTGCGGPVRNPVHHEVQLGDTLFSIAFHYGLDWRELAEWNGIGRPYRIYVGQAIALAPSGRGGNGPIIEDLPTRDPPPSRVVRVIRPAIPKSDATRVEKRSPTPTQTVKPAPAPNERSSSNWRWPTEGEVVTPYSPTNGKKGIDIRGSEGQHVMAAADGDVVYSGKGLIGYGNLIIIKHDDVWLSAYGHNSTLLVKEGDRVKAGQEIAQMGQNGKTGSILHFEIRKNGTPVDPARYLPRQ